LVALREVAASIMDGHTSLGVIPNSGYGNRFPVRLYEFSDGVYITGIVKEYNEYIGSRVIRIGSYPVNDALYKAGKIAFADNEFGRRNMAPIIATTCKYAFGLGLTDSLSQMKLEVITPSGIKKIIQLTSFTPSAFSELSLGLDFGPPGIDFISTYTGTDKRKPLYIKFLDGTHYYWFEHDTLNRALFVQFNRFIDQNDESFTQFSKRLFNFYDKNANQIGKFILDLRFNDGGSGILLFPFMNEIIKRDSINHPGHFYVLIGRRTFSAASLLVGELMLHTNVLLVGEPTGAAQNMFSDLMLDSYLPNCGAPLFISTVSINTGWFAENNIFIAPHYPAPFSSSDFFTGKDPAIDAIVKNKVRALVTVIQEDGPIEGFKYFNTINYDWKYYPDRLGITPFTFPIIPRYTVDFSALDTIGHSALVKNNLEMARSAFELNIILFPKISEAWESLADYYFKSGDKINAIKLLQKSIEINPDNKNAVIKITKLK
jgi:hypothetical protein